MSRPKTPNTPPAAPQRNILTGTLSRVVGANAFQSLGLPESAGDDGRGMLRLSLALSLDESNRGVLRSAARVQRRQRDVN